MPFKIHEMYDSVYRGKCHILLCCYLKSVVGSKQNTTGKKRKHDDDGESATSQPKRTATQKKIEEVEEIVSKLKEKHGDSFKVEHLNAWAHLIHVGKHSLMTHLLITHTLWAARVPNPLVHAIRRVMHPLTRQSLIEVFSLRGSEFNCAVSA